MIAGMVATADMIEIVKVTGCEAHICRVSGPEVIQKIKKAQQADYDVMAETCSRYLSLTDQDVLASGPLFKCASPLCPKEDVDRL